MSKRHAKSIQLSPSGSAVVGNIDWASLGDDPLGDMQIFAGAASQEAVRQRLLGEVETEVAVMLDAMPRSHTRDQSAEKLRTYRAAKKHQMQSDRGSDYYGTAARKSSA